MECLLFILIKIEAHHKASPVHEVNQFKTDLNVRYALKNLKKGLCICPFSTTLHGMAISDVSRYTVCYRRHMSYIKKIESKGTMRV